MPELLLELGCEELPASFVERAARDLYRTLHGRLTELGVLHGEGVFYGTPRRLIVSLPDLDEQQADSTKEQRGPGLKAAYDADGNPTPALLGFCRSQGVEPSDLRKDEQYVWVTKHIAGRATAELLNEEIPAAIRGLAFDKSMRWGESRMRFARPIRWILAVLGGEVLSFDVEGVVAADLSRGHRFYAPETFTAHTLEELLAGLRNRSVEPDPERRRATITEGAPNVAGGTPEMSEPLIDENVYLTEWPTPVSGEFPESYLELPEPVLVTAMAKHEKMFPVRDADGRLTNRFVFVRNSGVDEDVRKGNEWVLSARFNDAKFFFDEDRKSSLDNFLEKTTGIVFHTKLGTIRQRADRLERLCQKVAELTEASESEIENARLAGKYAKADLSTGLVSELASLQGIVGGEYARRERFPAQVAWALQTQYDLSKNTSPGTCDGERTSVRLIIADELDKLAGYLGLGLAPTGSSDPYGLRRAVTRLIEAAWLWTGALPSFRALLDEALVGFAEQGFELQTEVAHDAMTEIFLSRYPAMMPHIRYDLLEAALLKDPVEEITLPRNVRYRVECLEEISRDPAFIHAATRPINIVAAARKKGIEFDESGATDAGLQSREGVLLFDAARSIHEELEAAQAAQDAPKTVELLRKLAGPIHAFFDTTMVMVDDESVRNERLSLLHGVSFQLRTAGDFSKIVLEG